MSAIKLHDKSFDIYIEEDKIQEKVKSLAEQISFDYKDKNPLFIAILNGSFMFAADLFKNLEINAEICFIKLASYKGVRSTGHLTTATRHNKLIFYHHIIIGQDIM